MIATLSLWSIGGPQRPFDALVAGTFVTAFGLFAAFVVVWKRGR